jgi:hypothetical protein
MPLSSAPRSGPWDTAEITAHLDAARIPLRLATTAPSGWPVVLSLWFVRDGDELLCATQESASIVQALLADGRCAFEVAGDQPPYHGVRGRARVTVVPDENLAVLRALVTRYLGSADGTFARWLLGRTSPEVVLRLDPVELSSWDYRARMAPAAGTPAA